MYTMGILSRPINIDSIVSQGLDKLQKKNCTPFKRTRNNNNSNNGGRSCQKTTSVIQIVIATTSLWMNKNLEKNRQLSRSVSAFRSVAQNRGRFAYQAIEEGN